MPNNTHFYKYSFIALLVVDIVYAVLGNLAFGVQLSVDAVKVALIWFVCFFWMPVWLAAYTIFSLRKHWQTHGLAEWSILVVIMTIGAIITDHFLSTYAWHKPFGHIVLYISGMWGTIIYAVCRIIEYRYNLNLEQKARKQAQLESLRYQLNPHFMFNSLNTISAYIHAKPDLADEVLHELADILRYSLDTAKQKESLLSDELAIIKKYLNIEKARFGDNLNYHFDIEPALLDKKIPTLIIQPLIENAVKHNSTGQSLSINLEVKEVKGKLIITICDDGIGFTSDIINDNHATGVGLKNIRERIKQIEKGTISFFNSPGATIQMELPQ